VCTVCGFKISAAISCDAGLTTSMPMCRNVRPRERGYPLFENDDEVCPWTIGVYFLNKISAFYLFRPFLLHICSSGDVPYVETDMAELAKIKYKLT
jgi:hypothetical protein